MTIDRGRTQSN